MTRVLLGVMLGAVAATLLATVAFAAYAVWLEPAGSAVALALAAGITIVAQGGLRRSTAPYAGVLWLVVLGAYGLFLSGVPIGWCIAAACALVALNVTACVVGMYFAPPLDDD